MAEEEPSSTTTGTATDGKKEDVAQDKKEEEAAPKEDVAQDRKEEEAAPKEEEAAPKEEDKKEEEEVVEDKAEEAEATKEEEEAPETEEAPKQEEAQEEEVTTEEAAPEEAEVPKEGEATEAEATPAEEEPAPKEEEPPAKEEEVAAEEEEQKDISEQQPEEEAAEEAAETTKEEETKDEEEEEAAEEKEEDASGDDAEKEEATEAKGEEETGDDGAGVAAAAAVGTAAAVGATAAVAATAGGGEGAAAGGAVAAAGGEAAAAGAGATGAAAAGAGAAAAGEGAAAGAGAAGAGAAAGTTTAATGAAAGGGGGAAAAGAGAGAAVVGAAAVAGGVDTTERSKSKINEELAMLRKSKKTQASKKQLFGSTKKGEKEHILGTPVKEKEVIFEETDEEVAAATAAATTTAAVTTAAATAAEEPPTAEDEIREEKEVEPAAASVGDSAVLDMKKTQSKRVKPRPEADSEGLFFFSTRSMQSVPPDSEDYDDDDLPPSPRQLKRRASMDHANCNRAFMLLSPFTNTTKVRTKLAHVLRAKDVDIVEEYHISGKRMERKGLIDIALHGGEVAMGKKDAGEVGSDEGSKFKNVFGESYNEAKGNILNAKETMEKYNCTPAELYSAWERAQLENKVVCLKPEVYCGKLSLENGTTDVYVLNGFYPALRDAYVGPPGTEEEERASEVTDSTKLVGGMHAYELEWDEPSVNWAEFRHDVIGVVPSVVDSNTSAKEGTFLQKLYDNYDEMGLVTPPSVHDKSAIYVSTSPLQALSERCDWLARSVADDEYGAILLRRGIPETQVVGWFEDPLVKLPKAASASVDGNVKTGKAVRLSSLVEDKDASQCTPILLGVYDNDLFGSNADQAGCNCTIS